MILSARCCLLTAPTKNWRHTVGQSKELFQISRHTIMIPLGISIIQRMDEYYSTSRETLPPRILSSHQKFRLLGIGHLCAIST